MPNMDLPAVVLAIWTLTGVFFGLVASIYGAVLKVYRLGVVAQVADAVLGLMAGAITFLVLVATNWGVMRFWSMVAIVGGYGLWSGLAGAPVHRACYALFEYQAGLVHQGLWGAARLAVKAGRHIPQETQRIARVLPGHGQMRRMFWWLKRRKR